MSDARIPVVVGGAAQRRPGDRLLDAEPAGAAPAHTPGCACCKPRDRLAVELGRVFSERARNPAESFARVLVVGADPGAVAAAIAGDVLARARYRFEGSA